MALRFEHILTEGIAQVSYMVGDDKAGVVAVIDPRRDVDVYLQMAQQFKVTITHIFETHNHADFVSGARELADRTGTAEIHLSHEGGTKYGYPHQRVKAGDQFEFGTVLLKAHHTPGHTPEHMAYSLADEDHTEYPWGILTGDSLFVNSVGRPDLLGDKSDELVSQLYNTVFDFYLKMEDHVIIYPCHGLGSACGPKIGDRLSSTIGYERRFNPYLQIRDRQQFKEKVMSAAPPAPTYYHRMKELNSQGPEILGAHPIVPALTPEAFHKAMQKQKYVVVDTRHMLAFGGGHIENALNIGARPELSVWAGWMLDPQTPLLLVTEKDDEVPEILPFFTRTGYIHFAGYLAGGMTAWENAGYPLQTLPQVSVYELKENSQETQILDVRTPEEWEKGHIPGAQHRFVPELKDNIKGLRKDQPVTVYCDTGYRASLAASLLEAKGFLEVHSVPGSWQAWTHAGFEIDYNGKNK